MNRRHPGPLFFNSSPFPHLLCARFWLCGHYHDPDLDQSLEGVGRLFNMKLKYLLGMRFAPRVGRRSHTTGGTKKRDAMLRVWTKGLYAALIALSWQASAFGTDTLLVNGHIYTGNKAAPWADALAITGARIEAVGSARSLQARRRPRPGHRPQGPHGHTGDRRLAPALAFRRLRSARPESLHRRSRASRRASRTF